MAANTASSLKIMQANGITPPPNYGQNAGYTGNCVSSYAGNQEKDAYWYHPDHLGSSSFITGLDGEVTQNIEYFPSGEVFVENHKNDNLNSQYKFNGKEQDSETGYYYYGARYYNPRVSLWLNVDPLAEKYWGRSPYEYCFSNPIRFIDPTGMGPGDGDQASRSLPASETSNTMYLYHLNLGNSASSFQNYYNSLSQAQIHSMRVSIYQSGLGAYDTPIARGMYGLDNNGDINVPQSIKENLWNASGSQVFDKIKDNFATQQSGVTPGSANDVFNPIAHTQWMAARALAVTSNSEAKGMIAQTGAQCTLAYVGGGEFNFKPNPKIFGANGGYGWFGQNGMKVGGYKMEAMYMDTNGGGTFFSIKQMKNEGALFRFDWGSHKSADNYFHIHRRFYIGDTKIGSTKPWPKK